MGREEVRIGTTESIFRNVNERIAESANRFDSDDAAFVCECADSSCTHRVQASLDNYERVRAEPTRFLLAPGHDDDRVERVVERRRSFWIVDKFEQTVRATVRRLNPRGERT